MATIEEISERITAVQSEMKTTVWGSPERNAQEKEKELLIDARNRLQIAAKATTATPARSNRIDSEHCVTASSWKRMHG